MCLMKSRNPLFSYRKLRFYAPPEAPWDPHSGASGGCPKPPFTNRIQTISGYPFYNPPPTENFMTFMRIQESLISLRDMEVFAPRRCPWDPLLDPDCENTNIPNCFHRFWQPARDPVGGGDVEAAMGRGRGSYRVRIRRRKI